MLSALLSYFAQYGYWVVFFGVMLENAGVPVPGETILLAAGFFAAQGQFNLWEVMAIAAFGAVLGDNTGYLIGREVGRATLERYGRYVGLTHGRIAHMENYFESHGNKTILVARFITGLRVFAALLAGASRKMPWRVFFVYNVAGAVLWSVVITTLGYLFGQSLPLLVKWVGRSGTILLIVAIILGLVAWRVQRHRKSND